MYESITSVDSLNAIHSPILKEIQKSTVGHPIKTCTSDLNIQSYIHTHTLFSLVKTNVFFFHKRVITSKILNMGP